MNDNVFKARIKFFNERIEDLPILNTLNSTNDSRIHLYGFVIKNGIHKEKSSLWKTLEILDKNYDIRWISGQAIFSKNSNFLQKIFPIADDFDPNFGFDFPSALYINSSLSNKNILSWTDGLSSTTKIFQKNKNCFLHVREFLKNPRILEQYYPHLKYKE